jgi:GNAT superfamily N-acetyltransferase
MRIRRAAAADDGRIREIAARSKGHWGYDEGRLREWAAGLDLSREIWLADEDGEPIAWLALLPPDATGSVELDDLWVDAPAIGRGVGGELFRFACDRARELGGSALRWEAEPNAVGFYERMGAETVGTARGSWGRELPVMQVPL